jgi:hypothetical protein
VLTEQLKIARLVRQFDLEVLQDSGILAPAFLIFFGFESLQGVDLLGVASVVPT